MPQPPPIATRTHTPPSFYLTVRRPLHPGVILLAIAAAVAALCCFVYAMGHARHRRLNPDNAGNARSGSATSSAEDDKDDPNQIDTIVLGDPRRRSHARTSRRPRKPRAPHHRHHPAARWRPDRHDSRFPRRPPALRLARRLQPRKRKRARPVPCPARRPAPLSPHSSHYGSRPVASTCSPRKKSSPGSSSSGSATRPRRASKRSAPCR